MKRVGRREGRKQGGRETGHQRDFWGKEVPRLERKKYIILADDIIYYIQISI